ALRDALVAPKHAPRYSQADAMIPAAGSEIAKVTDVARKLVADPDVRGLTPRQRAGIVNWVRLKPDTTTAGALAGVASGFSRTFDVVEKTVSQLQDAMTRGETTSEDITRAYLRRLALQDKTYRSMLALNPRAVAEARALDAERA